ncbi:hypothetical protein BDV26DRAFT_292376 [Aspergillus bertholletiae]|uniref:Peptidase metallopeptidase domain-containing protein n=1 Tax=Aspergillus bertholletiae TaxID=1226010 RepID=A0A5N7B958_9EURO|nr:hypothetical protein BDV26DRAFT_292376 [Aspergillus bertholletiae]
MAENEPADICFADVAEEPESEIDLNEAIAQSFKINQRNESVGFSMTNNGADVKQPKLAMTLGHFWRPGSELKIAFFSGTDWQKDKVRHYAEEWTKHANLKFKWIEYRSAPVDILIDFDRTKGSWSQIGTNSARVSARGRPSMNFGWVREGVKEEKMRSTILHEFGHALGARHEHSSPHSQIQWNKEVIYAEYAKPPNSWGKEKVDNNVFKAHTFDTVQATEYDPDSIMLYAFPARYTLDNKGTTRQTVLSERDKAYMRFCYPKEAPAAGLFNTIEVASVDKPVTERKSVKYYHEKYASPPQLALGLNSLEMAAQRNIRVQIEALEPGRETFLASIKTWGDSILKNAGMTWLELGPKLAYIQSGVVDLQEFWRWRWLPRANAKWVPFATPFKSQPKVICFIKSLDLDHRNNWRFKTYPTDVSTDGFKIHLDSWGDSGLYGGSVTWLAYPSDELGVTSGRFSTEDIRSSKDPKPDNTSTVFFERPFAKMPNVLMALDELDFDCQNDLSLRVGTSMVREKGFDWQLQSWGESKMYRAGASFLAWGEPAKQRGGLTII